MCALAHPLACSSVENGNACFLRALCPSGEYYAVLTQHTNGVSLFQVGIVQFSHDPQVELGLGPFGDGSGVAEALNKMVSWLPGWF